MTREPVNISEIMNDLVVVALIQKAWLHTKDYDRYAQAGRFALFIWRGKVIHENRFQSLTKINQN